MVPCIPHALTTDIATHLYKPEKSPSLPADTRKKKKKKKQQQQQKSKIGWLLE